LQCVAVCCSVLQCVAVRCSVLQCVAGWCSVLQCGAACCSVLPCVAVCCSVLTCVIDIFHTLSRMRSNIVCCSVLQCVAVCCSVLQCVAVCCSVLCAMRLHHTKATWLSAGSDRGVKIVRSERGLQCVAVCCSVLQCVAVCCSVWGQIADSTVQGQKPCGNAGSDTAGHRARLSYWHPCTQDPPVSAKFKMPFNSEWAVQIKQTTVSFIGLFCKRDL